MTKIGLWAINGIGIGHTKRIKIIYDKLLSDNQIRTKILIESEVQQTLLKVNNNEELLVCKRPWKDGYKESAIYAIREHMKEIDGLIADLGSVPERRDFEQVMSPYIKKIFLIRWMTPERWLPVSQRLHDYDSNTLVLFVMPKDFFTEATGIRNIESLAPVEYQFLDGYLFQDNSDNNDEADDRIAFVCGLGGVHSETGYRQLIEAIKALSSVKELMPNVKTDAWIGNNIELYKFAKACTGIDQVYGISDCARPNWNKYKVVLGRSSYNTLLEIMTTSAIFVTAKFESDGEWGYHFYKYLEKYGVITAPYPDEQHMRSAVLHALLTHKMDDACIRNRQLEFRNAASEMISISKQFIRA